MYRLKCNVFCLCLENTYGQFCQYCVNGSYGNATTDFGCRTCDCNGNGDEAKNLCDMTTGQCFCLNNTDGMNCEKCRTGFVRDLKRYVKNQNVFTSV